MFSIENIGTGSSNHPVYRVKYKGTSRFNLEEWGFQCCGANIMFSLASTWDFWTPQIVDELIKFLNTYVNPDTKCQCYRAKETYFCITDAQVKTYCAPLVAHPKVKHLDRFLNKAHGPEHMNLFRLSNSGDFDKVPK